MPGMNNEDYVLIWIIIAFVLLLIFIRAVCFFCDFSKELKYLNMEIARADEDELNYYLYKRKRLWLSLLPFVKYR